MTKEETPMQREVRLWHRSFKVVCTKAHYAGQGTGWEVGDMYTNTFTRAEAEAYVNILNDDSWNPGCWGVQEDPYLP